MNWIVYAARALALLWGAFWTWFGLASGIGEGLDPAGIFFHAALPGLVFLATAGLAWRWETIGGVALVLEGLLVMVAYPLMVHGRFPLATILFVELTMALPPLAAGVLFLLGGRGPEAGALHQNHA
jgi:hypothetical protein